MKNVTITRGVDEINLRVGDTLVANIRIADSSRSKRADLSIDAPNVVISHQPQRTDRRPCNGKASETRRTHPNR